MKRLTVIVAALAAATSLLALDQGQTELEFNGWFRYTNKSTALEVTAPTASNFLLERGYTRLSHQWAPHLFTKFTVDVFSSDKYPEGATVRIKEAYLDYALPVRDFTLTAGCQKHYFGLIYSWDYTHPDKQLADDRGVGASADYGVTVNGFLPSGLGELQLGVYNGAGYKYAGKYLSTSPELLGNLRLTPLPGITLGLSAFTHDRDISLYKNDAKGRKSGDTLYMNADTANTKRFAMAPTLKVGFGPVSLTGEYIAYDYTRKYSYYTPKTRDSLGNITDSTLVEKTKDYKQSGFDLMPLVVFPGRKVEAFARFGMWERKEQSGDSMALIKEKSFTRYGAGFNYHFARRPNGKVGAAFQLAWSREQTKAVNKDGSAVDPVDTFVAQVRFEWNRLFTAE